MAEKTNSEESNYDLNISGREAQFGSGVEYSAAAFSKLIGASIDYTLLNTESLFEQTSANSIELQAKEQANLMREQFNQSVGNVVTGAAMRGVKTGEGSVQQNIEESSKALGEDITTMKKNAKSKANMKRAQASINKRMAKAGLVQGVFSAIGSGAKGAGLLFGSAKDEEVE